MLVARVHGVLHGAPAQPEVPARRPTRSFLKLPIFGPLLRKVAVARFTRTLGTMIASGVPILDGLDIVARTAGNMVIEEALRDGALRDHRGQDDRRAARRVRRVPGHGRADDRGR